MRGGFEAVIAGYKTGWGIGGSDLILRLHGWKETKLFDLTDQGHRSQAVTRGHWRGRPSILK